MAWWDRLLGSKRWGSSGGKTYLSDAGQDAGWETIGEGPPTVQQFNAVQNDSDQKIGWLFSAVKSIFDSAPAVPLSQTAPSNFLGAVQVAGVGAVRTWEGESGSWTVPANVYAVEVEGWSGGGGSGGTTGLNTSTSGGGGGSYGRCIAAVTPGQAIPFAAGLGGVGGLPGAVGGDGGTTSFGTYMNLPGGKGSGAGSGGTDSYASGAGGAAGTFGAGTSAAFSRPGRSGDLPVVVDSTSHTVMGGFGGGTFGGGGVGSPHVSHNATANGGPAVKAQAPGGGATGTGPNGQNGFTGASGLLRIRF